LVNRQELNIDKKLSKLRGQGIVISSTTNNMQMAVSGETTVENNTNVNKMRSIDVAAMVVARPA
jgi:hypothetical protein